MSPSSSVLLMVVMVAMVTLLLLANAPHDTPIYDHNIINSVRGAIREELARQHRPPSLPTIYVITPTYKRLEQIPDMTRLGQTLLHVPNLHWVVAEDAPAENPQVTALLRFLNIPHTYLLSPMPEAFKKAKVKPKGVANRNAGISWLKHNVQDGVMYFADDDNAYDIRLFEEIRYTRRVSFVPVGLLTSYGLSTPVVKDGRFAGWYDGWIGGRKFPVDMAGFAINVRFLNGVSSAYMPYKPGFEEDGFLKSLGIDPEECEFLAENCTKIYVWHTKTHKNRPSDPALLEEKYDNTNLRELQHVMTLGAPKNKTPNAN